MKLWKNACREKIITPDQIVDAVAKLRQEGKSIATLNGSFDLMHAGHLHIIYQASLSADILIVALNSDESIKEYKSPYRPIISLENRLQMMASISFVSYVTWFYETTPLQILSKIKPNVHINGEEYGENCMESETVKKNGGTVKIVQHVPGLSTSAMIEKIFSLEKAKGLHEASLHIQ